MLIDYKLIGIHGKMYSGKDFVCECLQEINKNFVNLKFAEPLKKDIADILGVDLEYIENNKNKELPEEWWYWENLYDERKEYRGEKIDDTVIVNGVLAIKLVKPTIRDLMIDYGNGMREKVHPNFWCNKLFSKHGYLIEDNNILKFAITDCRYPNEAYEIKMKGGIVIKVESSLIERAKRWANKINLEYTTEENLLEKFKRYNPLDSLSETSLDAYAEFDYIIKNDVKSKEEMIKKLKQY